MKKKSEKKMKLTAIKVARLTAQREQSAAGATHPTTTVIRTFDC
ncbi:hypothetical protein [Chitinophaga oryzae]|nr:hypothetical protein [Chitinophaga oryzae]